MPDVRLINATCPDCRGPLSEVVEDGVREYRCLVEHRYSDVALLHAHSETQERTLWAAVLVLEEAAVLARDVAGHLPGANEDLFRQAAEKEQQADVIRSVVEQLKPFVIP
jgi:two-component system chemotaxis response regulator CheB